MLRRSTFGRWHRARSALDLVAALAVIVLAAVAIVRMVRPAEVNSRQPKASRPMPAVPPDAFSLDAAPLIGRAEARVALVEYSDFECPFCGQFARDTFPVLSREYVETGKIRVAFRHLPVERLHPTALATAQAADCAGRQGKFWEMRAALFQHPRAHDRQSLDRYGLAIRLDPKQFSNCLEDTPADRIREDIAEAGRFGFTGTPIFLIARFDGGYRVKARRLVLGAQPVSSFRAVLDQVLAEK